MEQDGGGSFGFCGSWREYAPIAFTNLALNLATLGIYRFWAKTRTRQYLWSRSRFIDDRLEWTGTGTELLVGFLLAICLMGIPFLFLQYGAQIMVFSGHEVAAQLCVLAALLMLSYLGGVARMRSLRYRFSRTYWHDIRGGSDDNGFKYGLVFMGRTLLGYLAAGLLTPWAMITLWNSRMSKISFGPHHFVAQGKARPLLGRFLLFYLSPLLLGLLFFAIAGTFGYNIGGVTIYSNLPKIFRIAALIVIMVGVYALLGMITLTYYAAFLREAINNLELEGLRFSFEASTDDWLMLFFGDAGLVIGTLGIGWIFLEYRHWKFFMTHLQAEGEIDLNALTQSQTRQARQGEGLMDAFDVGAF